MTTCYVLINTIDKVKTFTQITGACTGDLDLAAGRYVVDAKSIMGIFSLDISAPLKLVIHDDVDLEGLKTKLEPFIVPQSAE